MKYQQLLNTLTTLLLASSRMLAAQTPTQTACDFLVELDGKIPLATDYYAEEGKLFTQYKDCLTDKSAAAERIKHTHDGNTLTNIREDAKEKLTIAVFGGSEMTECDANFGGGVRIGYEAARMGYDVVQGGGAGLMMAIRIGSDLFCRSVEDLEQVIALLCEEKTASADRKMQIRSIVTEKYATCQLQHTHSIHAAIYLARMPVKPLIGFGAQRVEIYNDYLRLQALIAIADVWVCAPGSEGTLLEFVAALNAIKYGYITSEKKQKLIVYNTTAWLDNAQIHPNKLNMPVIAHANSAEEVLGHINTFVQDTHCSNETTLHTCPAALYRQPKAVEKYPSVEQHSIKI
jgi:predicted Rossmann-fold nucleotide-binding protein